MNSEMDAAVAPSSGAPRKPNPFARIAGVIFSPVETLQSIARRPDVLVPLLILLVISAAIGFIVVSHVDFTAGVRDALASNPNIKPEQAEKAIRFSGMVGKYIAYASPLIFGLGLAIVAGVLLIAFRMMGGEGDYKQALSVLVYVSFVSVIESVLRAIVILRRGTIDAQLIPTALRSNLGFLTDLKAHPMLFALLSSVDIFNLWMLALLIVGFAFVSQLSRSRSAAIVVSLYVLVVLFKVGAGALQSLGTRT